MHSPIIRLLTPDEWPVLRELRLKALSDSPENIGGDLATESKWTETEWRAQLAKYDFMVASINGITIGGMNIEKLKGDFGATCWIGSCWIDPEYRGRKVLRALFNYLDSVALISGWEIQGIGVFVDNVAAIAAWEKLGFIAMGEAKPSTRKTDPQRYYQRMIRKSAP